MDRARRESTATSARTPITTRRRTSRATTRRAIRQLESILRNAVIVDDAAGDVVAPGVVVEIQMDGDDEAIEYLVGSIEERHETYEVLSVSSPLGQVSSGAEVGAVVTYEDRGRPMSVEVVGIRPL